MKSAAQSPAQPAPVCAAGSQTNTGSSPHFTLILFLGFVNADETPHFLIPGLFCHSPQVSSEIMVQALWVQVFISLDCKCSFEPQAVPCSRTWRRDMSNTLCLGESLSSLAVLCCGEKSLPSLSRSPRNVNYWVPGSLGEGAGPDSQADSS